MMDRTHVIAGDDPPFTELEAWIEAARQGEREALGRALSSVRDYLLLVANDGLQPALQAKATASDLVQDTFLQAQRCVQQFRGRTESEWRHWLRKILIRNIAQDRRRLATAKRQVQREETVPEQMPLEDAQHVDTPSRNLALRELETALVEGLNRIPDHYREVFTWHHREQLSFEEIGRRHGISAEAARKRWTRALGRLRKALGPSHDSMSE
jgi:RNA polymerase sigma-70 factor (ECF subfamily)